MNNEDRKIISYDPSTGEPIYEEEKKILRFNTETGAPIYEKEEDNIVGYNPNTGEPIYNGSENLMDDKRNKKVIGYDANTGFPIYEESKVDTNNIKKANRIQMTAAEKILLIVNIIILIPMFIIGFIFEFGGIFVGIMVLAYVIIDSLLYYDNIKKVAYSSETYQKSNSKISNSTIVLGIFFILMALGYFASYMSLYNYIFNFMENPVLGSFAILLFWPVYIFSFVLLSVIGGFFIGRIKKDIKNKFNM